MTISSTSSFPWF